MQQISNIETKKKEKKNNMLYTVTKIFGVDAIKTRVFTSKEKAIEDINENIGLFVDSLDGVEIFERENEETYYIINRSDDPTDFIEFVLRRCELK